MANLISALTRGTLLKRTARSAATRTLQSTSPTTNSVVSMRRNVLWALVGNSVYLVCQYLLLTTVAKLSNPTALGQFALATALVLPLIALSQMQLRQVQTTDVAGEYEFFECLVFRAIATAICLILIAGLAWSLDVPPGSRLVILLVGVIKSFESMIDVVYGRLQREERLRAVALSTIVRSAISLVVFAATLEATGSLIWAVASMAVVAGLSLAAFDLPAAHRLSDRIGARQPLRWHKLGRLIIVTAPLGLTTGAQALSTNLPRYFLEHFQGSKALALFAVAAAPLSLITLFSGAIMQATLPRAAAYFQSGRLGSFNRLAVRSTLVAAAIGLGFAGLIAVGGSALISFLFTPEYRAAGPALLVMSLGVALGSLTMYGSIAISASRHFYLQLLNIGVAMVVQVPVCLVLVPRYGVLGAAWAELIRFVCFVVVLGAAGMMVMARRRAALAAQSIEDPIAASLAA